MNAEFGRKHDESEYKRDLFRNWGLEILVPLILQKSDMGNCFTQKFLILNIAKTA
jgi:hypothetical protein